MGGNASNEKEQTMDTLTHRGYDKNIVCLVQKLVSVSVLKNMPFKRIGIDSK